MEPVYTVEEAAEKLKLTVPLVRQLLRTGKIKGSKIGKYWRIRESELEAFLNDTANLPMDAE